MFQEIGQKFIPEIKEEETKIVDDHEHIVDIESPEIKEKIEKAKELFQEFLNEYGERFDLDPNNESAIKEVYEAAKEKGIFSEAQKIRELIYDKNISIYGVCYLSNKCGSNFCSFCPMGQAGYRKFLAEVEVARLDKREQEILEKAQKHIREFEQFDEDTKENY